MYKHTAKTFGVSPADEPRFSKGAEPQDPEFRLKPYTKPRLVCQGRIMEQTLGPSPGTGESGNSMNFRGVGPIGPGI